MQLGTMIRSKPVGGGGDDRPRLLVVTNHYPPDSAGGGDLFADLCESLVSQGISVTVRAVVPYYPEWKDKSGMNGLRIHCYRKSGVDVERYGCYIPTDPSRLSQRLLMEGSLLFSLARSLFTRRRFDVVMAYCPFVACVAHGAMHAYTRRIPMWVNIQDIPSAAAQAAGIVHSSGIGRLLDSIQNWVINRGQVWSTVAPGMAEHLKDLRTRDQPVLYLPNWLHVSLAQSIHTLGRTADVKPRPVPELLYSGNIGRKQGLLDFCALLAGTSRRFKFRIHGDGAGAEDLRRWLGERQDERFFMGPLLDEHVFAKAVTDTDYFVITERPGSGNSYMPSKLLVALAAEIPVLVVSDTESSLGTEVRRYSLGPCYTWQEAEAAPETLVPIDSVHEHRAWRASCRIRARAYSRPDIIADFDSVVRALANDSLGVPDRVRAIKDKWYGR